MKVSKLLKNKYLLWTVVFLSFLHVLSYLRNGDLNTLSFFIASGWLTSFFSRNLLLQLVVSLCATNILYMGDNLREGLTEDVTAEDATDMRKQLTSAVAALKALNNGGGSTEKKEKKEKKKKSPFSQRNVPTSIPASLKEGDSRVGNRVDYAATLEQAYDNLQNMLGSSGMKGLTDETKHLVSQQKNLVESLGNMVPVLKGAQETMSSLESMQPSLGNLQEMMKELSTTLNN